MAVVSFSLLESATDKAIELLEKNDYKPGDAFLESEALAQALALSPQLAKQVLRELLVSGRIERSSEGYRVARAKLVRNTWSMSSLTEAMQARNLPMRSTVLSFEIIESPKAACVMLGLSLGEKVYFLQRLRCINGFPMVVEVSYLPAARFEGLLAYDFSQNSLYAVLDQSYGVRAENQSLEFLIEKPSLEECNWLEIDAEESLLTLAGKTMDQAGNVFEYSISKSPGRYTVYESSPVLDGLF